MDFDKHRNHHHEIKGEEKKFFDIYDLISFMYWSSRRILRQLSNLASLKTITDILKVIPGISYALLIFDFCFDLVSNTLLSQRSLHTRIFKTAMVFIATPVAILSFILSAALMNTIGACLSLVSNAWDSGTVIFSRLFGKLNDNDGPEANRKANLKLAESVHNIAINAFFILGSALLLNPLTTVAGSIILIAITAYAVLDRFKINPLRWLANRLFDHPFEKKMDSAATKYRSTAYVNDKLFENNNHNDKHHSRAIKLEQTYELKAIKPGNDSIFAKKPSVNEKPRGASVTPT